MIRFEKTKTFSRMLALIVFLYFVIMAIISVFVHSDNSVVLNTAALTGSRVDNTFNSAALILANADPASIIFWIAIILSATIIAFLIGKFLDKYFGKYYCINCVHKDTYITAKKIK